MTPDQGIYTEKSLLEPFDFGDPVGIAQVFSYLEKFGALDMPWFEKVTIADHIANVALFSATIAQEAIKHGAKVDIHKAWVMGWLRDVGRIPWAIAVKNDITDITEKYGHHGYLGYCYLLKCGVPEDLAIICMTHIGSGITAAEAQTINTKHLKRDVFPVRDWYATTIEEKIVVIADKIPGFINTVLTPYRANQERKNSGNKIYSWLRDQDPLWNRFWTFKEQVDEACGTEALILFDPKLLFSKPEAYARLPSPREISQMRF
ncbi:MAG: hypothetical protein U9Q67_05125 [Patescibacteria group bacterium]|nr:hypothetical protein [Patescibacteria group bacterium]